MATPIPDTPRARLGGPTKLVERSFGWLARCRRPARDHGRTAEVLAGWHWVAFTDLMLTRVMELAQAQAETGA